MLKAVAALILSKYKGRKDTFLTSCLGAFFDKFFFFFHIIWLRTKGASAELSKDSAQEQTHNFLHELNFMGLAVKQM